MPPHLGAQYLGHYSRQCLHWRQCNFGSAAGMVIYTGSIVNGAFGLLIIANSAVGVIQEFAPSALWARLSIVGRAKPMVIRNGNSAVEIDRAEVVLDNSSRLVR